MLVMSGIELPGRPLGSYGYATTRADYCFLKSTEHTMAVRLFPRSVRAEYLVDIVEAGRRREWAVQRRL